MSRGRRMTTRPEQTRKQAIRRVLATFLAISTAKPTISLAGFGLPDGVLLSVTAHMTYDV